MENTVYQLFLVLCRPNQLNFTQLIAVTFTTVRQVARISQQGENHKGEEHFNYQLQLCTGPRGVVSGEVKQSTIYAKFGESSCKKVFKN